MRCDGQEALLLGSTGDDQSEWTEIHRGTIPNKSRTPSPGLVASGINKPRITQDMKLQTGKLEEPIISPVLTLMSRHPATSLTFLESWKCYPIRVSLIRTDWNGITPPSHLQRDENWSADLCRWGRLHPLSSWHCSGWPVAEPTSWWPIFRKG